MLLGLFIILKYIYESARILQLSKALIFRPHEKYRDIAKNLVQKYAQVAAQKQAILKTIINSNTVFT
jgi:hypothetical protein